MPRVPNMLNKPINCHVGNWSKVGKCAFKCGGKNRKGQLYRRNILTLPKFKGTKCKFR